MLRVAVVAHPWARAERIEVHDDDTVGVWVRARPVEGQANDAIARLLASALGLRSRQVKIVGGAASRRKIVEVDLPGIEALRERVLAYRLRFD
jgi:uncharacterized protein YggU (UPF0235/DUF167 family)